MSIRNFLAATVGAALIAAFGLVTPAAADVALQQEPTRAYELTAGRLWSLVAAALGLIGIVTGVIALARAARGTCLTNRRPAIVALITGLAGALVGMLIVVLAEGGPGSGSGIVGGFMTVALGLIAAVLAVLALRPRRSVAR